MALILEQLDRTYERHEQPHEMCDINTPFDQIKQFYQRVNADIRERVPGRYGIDPYMIDWPSLFTPIESAAWSAIRQTGIPLYPQYPVDKYFVDFGDPVCRIALECDGKQWHDRDRDYKRDTEIRALGWTIYRVTGSECRKCMNEIEDISFQHSVEDITDEAFNRFLDEWSHTTSDGLIKAIGWKHYGHCVRPGVERYFDSSLRKHNSQFWSMNHG